VCQVGSVRKDKGEKFRPIRFSEIFMSLSVTPIDEDEN
jgi:hypothetical protein